MSVLFELIAASFYVAFVQNLVFNGGYGISEAVRMSAKPRKLIPLALFMTYFSVAVSAICAALELLPKFHAKGEIFHVAIFSAVVFAVYILTMIIVLIYGKVQPKTIRRISIAAFNTLVMAVPYINYRSAFTFTESIGSGLGAGLAFLIAVLLINEGLKRLDLNTSIPKCFKGTPALFIYTALLSLCFMGLK